MARTVTLPTNRGDILRLVKDFDGTAYFGALIADYEDEEAAKSGTAEIGFHVAGTPFFETAEAVQRMLDDDEAIDVQVLPYEG